MDLMEIELAPQENAAQPVVAADGLRPRLNSKVSPRELALPICEPNDIFGASHE
jgi:hypothetical protein